MELPPGPSHKPLQVLYNLFKRPDRFLLDCYRQYGAIFKLNLGRGKYAIALADPHDIKDIFTVTAKKFVLGNANTLFYPYIGKNSMITLDGERHTHHRSVVLKMLTEQRLRGYHKVMSYYTNKVIDQWQSKKEINIQDEMLAMILHPVIEMTFGEQVRARIPELVQLVKGVLELPQLVFYLPSLRFDLGKWNAWGRSRICRAKLDRFIEAEIEQRRGKLPETPTNMLEALMLARDSNGNEMKREEIISECLMMLQSGEESTVALFNWIFVQLFHHPEVLERLIAEVDAVVGNQEVTLDMLPAMPYLEAVIKETMRYNNVIPYTRRIVSEPVVIRDYTFNPGTVLLLCLSVTHRLPEYWPEPERFDPTRFLNESQNLIAWIPFGGGPRRCIGMELALLQMKITLATIISRARLKLIGGQQFEPKLVRLELSLPKGVRFQIDHIKPNPYTTPVLSGIARN